MNRHELYAFGVVIVGTLALLGCTPSGELVLTQQEPVRVEGGTLTYLLSQCSSGSCVYYFDFNASGMVSRFVVNESANGSSVTLDDSYLLSGVGDGYPSFNLSFAGQESLVAHDSVTVQYIRGGEGTLNRLFDHPGGRQYRGFGDRDLGTDGFEHGMLLDESDLPSTIIGVREPEFSIELSELSWVYSLQGTAVFETDRLRIISDGQETILLPNDSTTVPSYRESVRVRLEPLVGSWSEGKERYFEERRASRIEEPLGPFVLPLNRWVRADVIDLRYRADHLRPLTSPYTVTYRYEDDIGGIFVVAETTQLWGIHGVYPLFNLSDAQRVPDQEVSITIEYFANDPPESGEAILERGHVIEPRAMYCSPHRIARWGIIIDGVQRFGCDDSSTYDLSYYNVPATATFTNDTLVLSGEVNERLEDGESIVINVTVPAISVRLVPMTGSWEIRRS